MRRGRLIPGEAELEHGKRPVRINDANPLAAGTRVTHYR
jgi:hypothetical protein